MKTHSGEKSNKCNMWSNASSQSGDLRAHLETQCGEKSNKCNQCAYTSFKTGNLRTHLKTHTVVVVYSLKYLVQNWKRRKNSVAFITTWACLFRQAENELVATPGIR